MIKIQKELRSLAIETDTENFLRFCKTAEGEYAHGDQFLGVRVPVVRKLAKENIGLRLIDLKKLIKSQYHEERLLGLLILNLKYDKEKIEVEKEKFYQVYISHFKYINNWDLVDVTCPHIIGKHLIDKDRSVLYEWARSEDLWTKRIAMVSNWWFIRKGDLTDVFKLAKVLLKDEHDLIHKAVGWMLREAGKKDQEKLEGFLKSHYKNMPRTMLRYAIEKFPEQQRQGYLKGSI